MPFFNQVSQITTTWAAKPSNYVGRARITDVGFRGSDWYSDGTQWSHDGPVTLFQDGTGWIVPSMLAANASTFSQTGVTVTVTSAAHGFTAADHNGRKIYLILAGVGTWCSNFTYVSSSSFTCTSPTSQTTSGAITTNLSETIITDTVKTINGGLLGNSGILQLQTAVQNNNSANNKRLRAYIGASMFIDALVSTTTISPIFKTVRNTAFNKQTATPATQVFDAATTSIAQYSIDTSANFDFKMAISIGSANDYAYFNNILLLGYPS